MLPRSSFGRWLLHREAGKPAQALCCVQIKQKSEINTLSLTEICPICTPEYCTIWVRIVVCHLQGLLPMVSSASFSCLHSHVMLVMSQVEEQQRASRRSICGAFVPCLAVE